MPEPTPCQTADFFALRTPGLPVDALLGGANPGSGGAGEEGPRPLVRADQTASRQRLKGLIRQGAVREAVALASPDLAARVGPWLAGSLKPGAAAQVERGLWKYLSRLSHRSTPFGLFAGVSLGVWAGASHLTVEPWRGCRKALRLDWGALEALVNRLEQAPEGRASQAYRPNSSLYGRGGWYRFLEGREPAQGKGRTYHLEAVQATPHLDFVLQEAQGGAALQDLVARLAQRMGVGATEAEAFLEQVIQGQVLCGDLQPALTCADPIAWLIAALQRYPASALRAEPLRLLDRAFKAIQDAPLGAHPEGYGDLATPLAGLGLPPDTRDILQVDLFRPAPGLALSSGVRAALAAGADLLRKLTWPLPEGPLDRFRGAFLERYGTRWVPLLEVLDEESGLGFDGGVPMDSPLLEGLPFPTPMPARPFTGRDRKLLDRLAALQGSLAWELTDGDVEALANPDPQPFPRSFAALTSLGASDLGALDRGEFRFWMEQYSGPTAARWLGRFASGEPELTEALVRHLQKEEAERPEAVFAEVVHVPEGRMGNVLARPALRAYEIPFLATAGVAEDRTILPGDLLVTVQGGRVLLTSRRLGRQVVPRLSSAHHYARGPVVYRFLASLQDQDGHAGGWSWGALDELAFLPRVTRGRQVLSRARWRIQASELKAAMAASPEGAWGGFQVLRARLNLPRFVLLADGDNTLLVDLDQGPWVEALVHLVVGRPVFTLTECFPEPGMALVTAPEGRFAHELVIPFEAVGLTQAEAQAPPPMSEPPCVRAHPPGSEWLYLKLYCGPASVDRLLVEWAPFLAESEAQGLWDRWHFVRFADPEHHLRLRFHGEPRRLVAELLPLVHRHLERPLAQGLLRTWQVATYEPEVERYGGAPGLPLAEEWFFEDSQAVLLHLVDGITMDARWKVGLAEVDAIWAALGLTVPDRSALAQASRESFRKEFGDRGAGAHQIGAKFRTLRMELEQGVPVVAAGGAAPGLPALARLREALEHGLLQEPRARLAGSLAHMHLNRLLRINHRENEWVIMEFLSRLYASHLARSRTS